MVNKTTRDIETNDLVEHDGQIRRLADLAHYMDDEQREEIHAGNEAGESNQQWWERFAAAYPAEADHLIEITPDMRSE